MRRLLARPAITIRCQVILGALFIWAGAAKVGDPEAFACAVFRYQLPLLSPAVARGLAMSLPWVELIVGLSLVFGVLARSGALVAAVLLLTFIGVEGAAVARGLDIACGCFSPNGETQVGWATILRNVGMLLLALQVLAFAGPVREHERGRRAVPPESV
ncbi:MAG: MauE/DoxX family redox-associated membrane protein [Armatimonadota bacterium]